MPNIEPLRREQLPEFEKLFQAVESALGFVPNSYYTMGHRPEILQAFSRLTAAVFGPSSTVSTELKQLVALMASTSAGCRYCQAHTSGSAARAGAGPDKVAAVYEFESSALFSDAERAALRLARDAALVPNATTPAHFETLKKHFTDEQIVELMSVISLFGWLNRWNDTMATELEDEALDFASGTLGAAGWQPGKHRR